MRMDLIYNYFKMHSRHYYTTAPRTTAPDHISFTVAVLGTHDLFGLYMCMCIPYTRQIS